MNPCELICDPSFTIKDMNHFNSHFSSTLSSNPSPKLNLDANQSYQETNNNKQEIVTNISYGNHRTWADPNLETQSLSLPPIRIEPSHKLESILNFKPLTMEPSTLNDNEVITLNNKLSQGSDNILRGLDKPNFASNFSDKTQSIKPELDRLLNPVNQYSFNLSGSSGYQRNAEPVSYNNFTSYQSNMRYQQYNPSTSQLSMTWPNPTFTANYTNFTSLNNSITWKPFQCDVCYQRFGRAHDLKRHQNIHLNLKPYHCLPCNKQFSRLDALKRHQITKKCRINTLYKSGGNNIIEIENNDKLTPKVDLAKSG